MCVTTSAVAANYTYMPTYNSHMVQFAAHWWRLMHLNASILIKDIEWMRKKATVSKEVLVLLSQREISISILNDTKPHSLALLIAVFLKDNICQL